MRLFLRLDGTDEDLIEYITSIKDKIKKWIGIPVSIGIGKSKTLAKIANHIAKRIRAVVLYLKDGLEQQQIMDNFDIKDIWGIGRKLNIRLKCLGIGTASQLRDYYSKAIRKIFGVMGEKLVMELKGIDCHETGEGLSTKKILFLPDHLVKL